MTPEEPTTLRDQLEDAVDTTIPDPQPEVTAPETWTDEDKTYFNGIQDPKARQWLVTRDGDLNKRLTDTETKYKAFDDVFKPYDDRIKGYGQSREQVITNLLQAQTVLETKPVEGLAWLVKTYKISPEQVLQALNIKAPVQQPTGEEIEGNDDPYADLSPALAAKMRERDTQLDSLLNGQRETQDQQVQQVRRNLVSKAQEFKETKDDKGQPLYPYMADQRVVDEMSKLLKSSIVKVEGGDVTAAYKNAYERAIYAFPDIKDKIMTTVDQDRVNRARKAGVSVRGQGAARVAPSVGTSVRAQLEAAYQDGKE